AHGIKSIRDSFQRCIRSRDLDAHLVQLDERITHRERVDLIRRSRPGGGEIIFQGVPAGVVEVPRDRSMPVVAEGMQAGPDQGRWRHIALLCNETAKVARSDQVGYVGVDYARLMFADVDALAEWQHEDSLDGLADFVFWGRDAKKAARRTKAPQQGDHEWGWV